MKEALFYKKGENGKVYCQLCPHFCEIKPGQTGSCSVRQNIDGKLFSTVFGKAIAMHIDPIEKKPLFHVAPGSASFSVATAGCNFNCKFCQNHDISQVKDINSINSYSRDVSPDQIVLLAKQQNCQSIAYTYTEPTIYFEYAYETAKRATEENILNIFVTNGYINKAPVEFISPYLDAANVDLKSFSENFYKKLIGAKLTPVLETLKLLKKLDIWIEVTTLVIPGENDSKAELNEIAGFIKNELGAETPWHISRFFPQHKLDNHPPTPVSKLNEAYDIGKQAGLKYIYMGNVPGNETENTFCSKCGTFLIKRNGYQVKEINIKDNKCLACGTPAEGLRLSSFSRQI